MVVSKDNSKAESTDKLVKQLIQNNVTLQSKSVDLLGSVGKLTTSVSDLNKNTERLLKVFETAAKNVSEAKTTDEQINALAMKLENLLEQNKNIARGLILLEQYVRGKSSLPQGKPLTQY
ncbi:MAG: hypothetical protein PHF86_05720 [Candidatus Nanoarchaeia archaeon]|nr:hypothetical protein [Candidatus Nanoarchaeia archaeon]